MILSGQILKLLTIVLRPKNIYIASNDGLIELTHMVSQGVCLVVQFREFPETPNTRDGMNYKAMAKFFMGIKLITQGYNLLLESVALATSLSVALLLLYLWWMIDP